MNYLCHLMIRLMIQSLFYLQFNKKMKKLNINITIMIIFYIQFLIMLSLKIYMILVLYYFNHQTEKEIYLD